MSSRAIAAVFLTTLFTSVAIGRDLYVNNATGSDDLNGLEQAVLERSGPVATINRALELASSGDHIHIAKCPEPYREQIVITGCRLHGLEHRPLRISSDGAVLDGTVLAAQGAWRHVAGDVFAMRPRRLRYQQLFRSGEPLTRVRQAAYGDVQNALQPLEWDLAPGAIVLRTEKDKLPSYYDLRHAGLQTGITLYNTRNVVIEGLVVQGFQQDGVNAHDLVGDCVLRDLDCRANGRSGLSVGGASRVSAEGCNFYDNGAAQVRTEGLGRLALRACELDDESSAVPFEQRSGELLIDGKPAGEAR